MTEMKAKKKSQPPKPDTKKNWQEKKVNNLMKVAILMTYESERLGGKTTEDILAKLSKKWGRSPRQIQRYIEDARQLIHYEPYEELGTASWRTTMHPVTGQWLLVKGHSFGSVSEQGCESTFVPSNFIMLTSGKVKPRT
ncbi:hypothetical protein ES707_06314 [subsurface metagenome]